MKRTKLERLLVPFGLAVVLLALIFVTLSLFTPTSRAGALPQMMAARHAREQPVRTADLTLQATEVPSISNVIGATYDEARGEVIVFGVADSDLPGLDFSYIRENLVIGLRSFYDSSGPEIPGVSIEGTEDPLDVIYFGTVTNTHFGQVSFESDRLLKIYTMGVDNLTGITVTSNVTDYMSYPDRMQQLTETETDPITIRYFFTPTLLVEPITTPHTIIFSQTQKFVDWAYMSAATSTATAEAAQGFVDNFNQYYWDYAAERRAENGDTTLYEMIQLSKLTAIAQWAHEQGLELKLPGMNDPWLSHYPVTFAATVTQTPGITVTWTQTVSGSPYEFSLQGGVYAIGQVIKIPYTEAGQEVANDVYDGLRPPMPLPMMYLIQPNLVRPCDEPRITGGPCSGEACSEGPLVGYIVSFADNAMINGDFENGPGSAPWIQASVFEMIRSESPHNGTYGALFPVYHNAQVSMFQPFYIPSDATKARLTYWRAAATGETTHPHDFFASFLVSASDARLTTFETLDDGDADGYWRQVSFDVGAYAGQTVQLWFTATTDAASITNFFVDDVSLDYLDLTPPTIVTVTAPDTVTQLDAVEFEIAFHERMKTATVPTVTISLQGSQTSYTLTAKTGAGYTNGYLDSDTTQWHGVFTFTAEMDEGTCALGVSAAQDLADNVMHTVESAHTFIFDATLPQLESTFPADGASDVPAGASIVITFSETISTSTFAYTVSPDPGGWAESWDGATRVATLTHNDFASGTTCTVTVTEAKDLAGNSLSGAPVRWSFTTAVSDATPPEVESTYPTDGASGVTVDVSIVVTFSEAISTGTFAYTVSPDPGGWAESWDGATKVATLTHNDFASGTTYTVTVTEAKDLAGNPLNGAPVTWSFTTAASDTTPPQVESTSPADGASDVPADASIVITFSEAISTSTFAYTVSPDPGGWAESWDGATRVATLTHNDFAPGTTYAVTITEAKDLAGNSLDSAPVAWSFTTSYKVYLPTMLKSFVP